MPAATLTLFCDAKARTDRFAICDRNGAPVWCGPFGADRNYTGEQNSGEMAAAMKAVWLASKVHAATGSLGLLLTLKVDAEWLTWANDAASSDKGGEARKLAREARHHDIDLVVEYVRGSENPADRYTTGAEIHTPGETDLASLVDGTERRAATPDAEDGKPNLRAVHNALARAAQRSGERGATEAQIGLLARLMVDAGQDGSEYILSSTVGLTKADASDEIDMLTPKRPEVAAPKPAFTWVKEGANTFALRPGLYNVSRKRYGKTFRWQVKNYRDVLAGAIEAEFDIEAEAKAFVEARVTGNGAAA